MERIKPESITPEQAKKFLRNAVLNKPRIGLCDMAELFMANMIDDSTPFGRAILAHERAELACLSRITGEPIEKIIENPYAIPIPEDVSPDYPHRVAERYERRFAASSSLTCSNS